MDGLFYHFTSSDFFVYMIKCSVTVNEISTSIANRLDVSNEGGKDLLLCVEVFKVNDYDLEIFWITF